MTAGAPSPERDQAESAFAMILADFVHRIPGAEAAALVDWDGECVDYAIAMRHGKPVAEIDPFDIKVAGAHWAIVLDELARRPLGAPQTIVCRGDKRSFIVHTLPERYALVVLLKRWAGFVSTTRALDSCERAIAHEAAWSLPKGRGIWVPVDVEMDERSRPVWLTTGSLSRARSRCSARSRGSRVASVASVSASHPAASSTSSARWATAGMPTKKWGNRSPADPCNLQECRMHAKNF